MDAWGRGKGAVVRQAEAGGRGPLRKRLSSLPLSKVNKEPALPRLPPLTGAGGSQSS